MGSDSKSAFQLVEKSSTAFLLDDGESPLSGFKTNDIWYHKVTDVRPVRINTKVIGCGGIFILLTAGVIAAAVWGSDSQKNKTVKIFTHDNVRVLPTTTKCGFKRNCTAECTENIILEHEIGCCSGCGLKNTCNFPVNISWYQVPLYDIRQRIWMFVTLDGHYFFHSGYAPFVTNATGWTIVGNGCFGDPGHAMVMVACLSDLNLQDLSFEGFPANSCNSTWGYCSASNGIYVENLGACKGTQWEGNFFVDTWNGPLYSNGNILSPLLPLAFSLLLLFKSWN